MWRSRHRHNRVHKDDNINVGANHVLPRATDNNKVSKHSHLGLGESVGHCCHSYEQKLGEGEKLDGVGPVDNRPSTN